VTTKKAAVTLGLVMAMVLAASAAFAWGPGFGYGPVYGAPALSPEQIAQLQKIQADQLAVMAKLRSEMFAKRLELQALYREPALDQAKISAKQQELLAIQMQIQENALAVRTAAVEVLTPEQRGGTQ